jgi:hypothetical protein
MDETLERNEPDTERQVLHFFSQMQKLKKQDPASLLDVEQIVVYTRCWMRGVGG